MFEENGSGEAPPVDNDELQYDKFILDKDQLDSLLAEAQTISPSEKAQLDTYIETANSRICAEFDGIITPLTGDEMKNRFIFVDHETMNELMNAWVPQNEGGHSYLGEDTAAATTVPYEGKLVVEKPTTDAVWNSQSPNSKRILIEKNGDEKAARSKIKEMVDVTNIIHETTHMYQSLPDNLTTEHFALMECQAFWAGRELADEDQKVYSTEKVKRADFYQHLMDKYGKDLVHSFAMTGETDEGWITFDIEDEFTEDVLKDLFPSLKYKPKYGY